MSDVTALAQAFLAGQINPSYTTNYFQPAYLPQGQMSALPSWLYADASSTAQIASLLGGSVFQAPPPGNYQGTGIPNANWIQTDGGSFVPGDVFPPGVILSYASLCQAATSIAGSIPGGTVGNSCNQSGTTTPAYVYGTATSPVPTVTTNTVPVVTSAVVGNTVASTNAVAQTNVPVNTTNTNAATTTDNGNVFTEESISGVPNWILMLAAGVGIFFLVKGQ
jgi:hypothetical protein